MRDLKNYPTPNKHPWSTGKKYPTPNKHPRTQKKIPPHLTNIRDLKLFSREKFTRKNGKKYVSHLSKGCARTPIYYTTYDNWKSEEFLLLRFSYARRWTSQVFPWLFGGWDFQHTRTGMVFHGHQVCFVQENFVHVSRHYQKEKGWHLSFCSILQSAGATQLKRFFFFFFKPCCCGEIK